MATLHDSYFPLSCPPGHELLLANRAVIPTYHTATLLPNGNVLVVGGSISGGASATAEVYDRSSGTWSSTGSMNEARLSHTATLLPNGQVLVVGGHHGGRGLASAELYDPSSGSWSVTGSASTGRYYHTATLLPNGTVLITGGTNGNYLPTAELYMSSSGTWLSGGSMSDARHYHTATLLPTGEVLVSGGFSGYSFLSTSELYTPDLFHVFTICPLYDQGKPVKSGSTVPIKLQLCDAKNTNVSSASIVLHAQKLTNVSTTADGLLQDVGSANPDSDFRYNPTLSGTGGYIYNLSTKNLTTGTYVISFTAGAAPAIYTVQFEVK